MKKITFNASLNHKAYSYEPMKIEVEKVITLYGYLKPEVKRTVDRIFELLASNESIQKMYDLWCEMEQQKCCLRELTVEDIHAYCY